MFRSTRSPSQRYHVATVCGEPSGRSEATTAGFGRRRNSSISGGSGSGGKRAFEDREPALELVVGSGQRREEPDHVPVEAAGEEQQALLSRGDGDVAGALR
jgi:hypothetical protein